MPRLRFCLAAPALLTLLVACGGVDTGAAATSSSSGGGSGGAGAGGAGGAGGGEVCPNVGDTCTECEAKACPKEYCECYHSSECIQLAECTGQCGLDDTACNQPCWTAHPSMISLGALLVNCAGTVCSAGCPGYKPIGACLVCLYTSCQPEMNACVSQPDCTQLLACLNACTTPMCQTDCYQQHPSGSGPAGPVATCGQKYCSTQCAK